MVLNETPRKSLVHLRPTLKSDHTFQTSQKVKGNGRMNVMVWKRKQRHGAQSPGRPKAAQPRSSPVPSAVLRI